MDGAGVVALSSAVVRYFYLKQVTSYATVSSMVLILYDFVTTFSQEVELVWFSSWSTPKIVYLLNRYSSLLIASLYMFTLFFGAQTTIRCQLLSALIGWQYWISTSLVQLILLIWLYALWGRNRRLLYPVSVVFVVLSLAAITTMLSFSGKIVYIMSHPICVQAAGPSPSNDPSLVNKVNLDSTSKMPTYALAVVLCWTSFTVCLLGLIAYRVLRMFRSRKDLMAREEGSLAYILVRDSIVYSFFIFCTVVINLVMTVCAPTSLYSVAYGFNVVVPCVLSSHILLNLRAWEKWREDQVDVQGVNLTEWPTMFHLTTESS